MPKSPTREKRVKIRCEKCGLYFRDRGEEDFKTGSGFVRTLCWNCGIIWKMIGLYTQALGQFAEEKNRQVVISLENFYIRKKPKFPYTINKTKSKK